MLQRTARHVAALSSRPRISHPSDIDARQYSMKTAVLAVLCGLNHHAVEGFITGAVPVTRQGGTRTTVTAVAMQKHDDTLAAASTFDFKSKLRSLAVVCALSTSIALAAPTAPALAEAVPEGTNPFTSICMGFGCGEFRGLDYGGAPAPTDEDSIPFKSFLESLDKKLVTKVEFQSGGNKAYAWVKTADKPEDAGARIRIGEGYPEEQSNGWSSPLWVVRALKDRNVPYNFTYDLGSPPPPKLVSK